MSNSSAQLQLSPTRSPSLAATFSRSPPRDTPATPQFNPSRSPQAPPTPPDSSARTTHSVPSPPLSSASPGASSDLSLSSVLSASSQFQSRILDTPIDLHCLAPELDSPAASQASLASGQSLNPAMPADHGYDSPTPTQESAPRKVYLDALPPPFVPAASRSQVDQEDAFDDDDSADSRPPNVYINGLPPNFPEEDLLAITRPYGNVLSVRTFTRHVSDKPSGYGFVLFETLAAAEKCIEELRTYRNLHPSFSKQVHKIPGTPYASVPSALVSAGPADTFKAKMEQLGDVASTNLYMEGLPLSITEDTLRALVTPFRIMSSRFFHTRLSSPPRIIAFVRLESRDAAEDIIERLHGRLVRGWNDAGCRISVRFADTAEQRELRRTERHTQEGDSSPARLTMARAALLNLKGTQYQTPSPPMTDINLGSLSNLSSPITGFSFGMDYGGQLAGASPLGVPNSAGSPGSLDNLNAHPSHIAPHNVGLESHLSVNNTADRLDDDSELQLALLRLQGLRGRAQNGYTPVEQLILQAHNRQQNTRGLQSEAPQARGSSTRATGIAGHRVTNNASRERRLLDYLPQVSEEEFHATASFSHLAISPEVSAQPFSRAGGDSVHDTLAHQRNHTLATQGHPEADHKSLRIRSSTLPSQYLGTHAASVSTTNTTPLYDSSSSLSSNAFRSSTATHNPCKPMHVHSLSPTLFSSKNNVNVPSTVSRMRVASTTGAGVKAQKTGPSGTSLIRPTMAAPSSSPHEGSEGSEGSPAVSPALTYSTRTPASLSPSTPYSGFFPDGAESFNVPGAPSGTGKGDMRVEGGNGEHGLDA
ncbi:uncharacterized protein BXZ73DRAFT_98425 [Epithele typhae]|uniref:uncharacterized protein n=1 Tax=Epithele typhae TaxID=378194 RepID=UPI002008DC3D|nr:uncharacterized protein BXZ73DRAFT_98425 [Epithele typhae]KAH9941209.1 hypothetical protein BXZ73DRAFT_98425 [Epithele typhae]